MRTNPNPIKGNAVILIPLFHGRTGLLLAHEIFEGYKSDNTFSVIDTSKTVLDESVFTEVLAIPIIANFQIKDIYELIQKIKSFKIDIDIIVLILESFYIKYSSRLLSIEKVKALIHRGYVNDKIKHELGLDFKRWGVK